MTKHKPNIRLHENGRISFPGVVQYRVHTPAGIKVQPYPPTFESHPGPSTPVPLASANAARLVAEGKIKPLRSSLPFTLDILDLAEFERLEGAGWTRDPRHFGAGAEIIDNRRAPGA